MIWVWLHEALNYDFFRMLFFVYVVCLEVRLQLEDVQRLWEGVYELWVAV